MTSLGQTDNKFDFDGIRIDSLMHMDQEFVQAFVGTDNLFHMGDCFTGDIAEFTANCLPYTPQ